MKKGIRAKSLSLKSLSQKQRQKLKSREAILASAAKLFRKNGYMATGIDAIMADAGLTAGAFYSHFSSKQKLLQQSLIYSFKKAKQQLVKSPEFSRASTPLEGFILAYLSSQHRDNPENGCPIVSLGPEIHRLPRAVQKILSDYILNLSDGFENSADGLFLISATIGVLMVSRLVDETEKSDDLLQMAAQNLSQWILQKNPRKNQKTKA